MSQDRLYNSALIDNYIELLKDNYPTVSTNEILNESGIESWELDPGNWFTQETVNKFQQVVVDKTGNPNIAKEVGRCAAGRTGSIMRQAALSLLTPSNLYALVSKISARYSRAIEIQSRKLSNNSHEIIVRYKPGVKPEKFQCLNLQGYLEAMCFVFYSKFPKIDHQDCIFEGAKHCRYIIYWQPSKSQILKIARSSTILIGVLATLLILFLNWPLSYLSLPLILALTVSLLSVYYEKNELVDLVGKQDFKPHDVLDSHNKYYRSVNLINEVAKSLSRNTSVEKVLSCVGDILLGLNYDSGLIFTFDFSKDDPWFKEAYYFSNTGSTLINSMKDKRASSALIDSRLDKPIIKNFSEIEKSFPESISSVLSKYNCTPNIYLPIFFEQSLLGIIFIHNIEESIQASDLHLLNTLASQSALSIANIYFYRSLLKSETLRLERDFVTVASHEMHTPIQIINLAYQYIGMTLSQLGLIDGELSESLESLEQAVVKLNHISSNVLNFSRLESKIEFLPVPVEQLLAAIKTETKYIASTFGHAVSYLTDNAQGIVKCHADSLVQVVSNLIENSAKYTPQNGRIDVILNLNSAEFTIKICDNGIGIPEKFHDKIFKKFYQIQTNRNGCGLGLSFCQDVITKYNGYFNVESPLFPEEKVRKGTCITVHLPIDNQKKSIV